ncbi:hypothetical protein P153DRAFT_372683 [Dothidotthia symphoricarpi CBS 119687]|uniref:Glycosyltransferase family 23 protein n=1 Tax=Dothidotthia symphoricarpi CBS 119687 TaxID=1392245 RepID=A0A6A6ATD9_9PLEO|nr:uncharacterized protein P153DRAFT_372683 [Dothidotthia symphoricarpi CBS 119687]KAF2134234.1 hypothetical protein P153DRAFT_372683 [Dothidotthia symphoricarpi CBS 119687]
MLNQATQKFSKMHARRNPNLSIQTPPSYSYLEPPPHSATSGALLSPTSASRRGLLSSQSPLTPSLPSLIPRHGRKQWQPNYSRLVKRILIGCCGVVFLLWLVLRQMYDNEQQTPRYGEDGEEWEMVGGSQLPQEPAALALQDANGKMRWTVSIPENYDFPLRPAQYREICHQSFELSKEFRQDAQTTANFAKRMLNYYQKDQYYLDVQEAEEQGLLPTSKVTGKRPKGFVEDEAIADGLSTTGLKVCDKTLTYVMETEDAGFGNTLMRLWMSYGLAQTEGRTFFIDDTRWPYGKYLSYFIPPPTAGCLPPPKSHMVPCPHTARHIVISGATVKSHFGHAFTEEWEDATKMRVQRQHKIFALLRTGYEALFKLRPNDAKYVLNRALDVYGAVKQEGGISIGMHVRHGDKHPMEYQYQKDYIPLARYLDTARDLYIDLVEGGLKAAKKRTGNSPQQQDDTPALFARHTTSKLVLASDDPAVYESPELGPNSLRAQDHIVLATKAALEAAHGKKNPWIDEITGWEGGFYRDVFFSLGQPVGNADDALKLDADNVPDQAMKLRELVGRVYLLDLAVLGKADTLVCTVSSVGCRLLAVMMGWEGAVKQGRWRNIDGDFDWRGIMW